LAEVKAFLLSLSGIGPRDCSLPKSDAVELFSFLKLVFFFPDFYFRGEQDGFSLLALD
jgi:hypothetical protein